MKVIKSNLSQEQQNAVSFFGKDLCVSAGAGSGKTTVLVERYFRTLLQQGCAPKNILAVTFTDKAAGEMKKKLVARCEEMRRPDLRRQLENACIGTIHHFCARILKEYPIECGVDPDFSVLGSGEAELLAKKTLDRLFEQEASNPAWLGLLKDCGEEKLRKELLAAYDAFRANGASMDLLRIENLQAERQAHERKLEGRLRQFIKEKNTEPTPTLQRFYDNAQALLACLRDDTLSGGRRLSRLAEITSEFKPGSSKARESMAELKALSHLCCLYEAQSLSESSKRVFVELFLKFKQCLEEEKKKTLVLDFEDLLFFVHQALSGVTEPERVFLTHLKSLYSHILVDEYQDTSPLQAKIITLLKRPGNLFVVGDVRQSIYGFRHASPEVFRAASRTSKNVELVENYRARPELLDFVNCFSSRIFAGQHRPLKAVHPFSGPKKHCVELICAPKEEGKDVPACRVIEARTMAARIRALVDSGVPVAKKGKGKRPVIYSDIAILMRSTTSSHLYEAELEAFGIPTYAHKGRGFFEKMEVVDLLNVLKVLENPRQDIALASVLRSPLAQLSDDGLFWLAMERAAKKRECFYDALEQADKIKELSDEDRRKLKNFKSWTENLRKDKDRLKISEMLQRILNETAYEAKLMTREGALQARANVQKLNEIARSVEEKGISGAEDFVLYLKNLAEREVTEPEARILGEAENVVHILTIHAAKGLEFPCVILADMGAKTRSNDSPNFYTDMAAGLGAKVKNQADFQFYKDKTYADAEADLAQRSLEEQKRLFYVAMTRAKEHLILSGVRTSSSWMEETLKYLGLEAKADLPSRVEFEGIPVEVVPICRASPIKKTATRAVSGAFSPTKQPSPEFETVKNNLEPLNKPYENLEDLSVTRLLDSRMSEKPQEQDPPEELSTPRNEYGTVFHRIMETAVRHRPGGVWQENLFLRWMRTFNDDEKNEMRTSFEQFWKGAWGLSLLKAAHCYAELPFIYKTRYGILKGQIDLVFQDKNGHWVILDYKTNRISDPELARVAESYRWQLAFYALVFQRLVGAKPKTGVLYFSSLHRAHEFSYDEKDFEIFDSELEARYHQAVF